MRRDGRPGWDPENDARILVEIEAEIAAMEDGSWERHGMECELEWRRAAHLRHCGRRWPEENT